MNPYEGRKHILVHDQNVSDIITNILKTHKQYLNEYNKIAIHFKGRNINETAYNIWKFIKNNIDYKIESDDKQLLKSPSAILYTAKSIGSDCKNYSLFAGGILDSLNRSGIPINWCYRFASYKIGDKLPHHVFVVINPDTNNEIWIDPVLSSFNQKKQYFFKLDRKPMSLIAMSGVSYEGIGRSAKRTQKVATRKAAKEPKKQERKAKVVARAKKIKEGIKKAGKVVLKFAPISVAARNAFLALVKLNARSLANNLQLAVKKNEAEVKKFWTNIGGNYSSLVSAINVGSRKKRLGFLGDPATAAAATAAATPLLIKIVQLFKKLGIRTEDVASVVKAGVNQIAQNKLDEIDSEIQTGEESDSLNFAPGGATSSQSSFDANNEVFASDPTGESIMTFAKNNKFIVLAGAGLAAYLLFKKK